MYTWSPRERKGWMHLQQLRELPSLAAGKIGEPEARTLGLGFRGLGLRGLGFRGLGFRGLEFRKLIKGLRGVGV